MRRRTSETKVSSNELKAMIVNDKKERMLRSTLCTVERGTNNGVGGGDTSSSSSKGRGSNVPQLIRKNYVRSMSNNKKPNHKKIQYMLKIQSKMKPDQHTHTHTH